MTGACIYHHTTNECGERCRRTAARRTLWHKPAESGMGINEVREFPGCRGGYLLLPIVQKQHEAEKERTNERDKKRDNKGRKKKQYRRCHAKKTKCPANAERENKEEASPRRHRGRSTLSRNPKACIVGYGLPLPPRRKLKETKQ